jgi:hypothetical protein
MFAMICGVLEIMRTGRRDDGRMTIAATSVSWEQFFAAELSRLRGFYSIELSEEDFREIEEWLKDRLEVHSMNAVAEKMEAMNECDIRQLKYDFVQLVKRNRRFRKSPAHGRQLPVGQTNPLDENEERDRRTG